MQLYLPRAASPDDPVARPDSELTVRGNGERVLLIEDEAAVREMTLKTLRLLGYQATGARDAAEARTIMGSGEAIDLALSDVVLPGGVNGIQLADELKKRRPDLPVVLMSGYPAEAFVGNESAAGGFILLRKPVRRAELAKALSSALR